MPARSRFVAVLPWLLCAGAVALVLLYALLQVVDPAVDLSGAEVFATVVEILVFAGFPLVGAVLAARMPTNPYGWVWCALSIALGVLGLSSALAAAGTWSTRAVVTIGYLAYLSLGGLLVFVFLLFPTGRLPSRGWRWLARATVVLGAALAGATPFAPTVLDPGTPGLWAPEGTAGQVLADLVTGGVIGLLLLMFIAITSLVPRFRHAGQIERQQLKWFVVAAAVNASYVTVDEMFRPPSTSWVWIVIQSLTASLIPIAVGVAVLRYRLYEIDRIVSRTVTYGSLTVAIFAVYVAVVAVLSQLGLPEGSSDVVVAAVTLAVAALVGRVRRRLQVVVDRRFDRARYDAARAVDAFAARLRDEVDLDEVALGLRDTVVSTVAPTRVAVWLRAPRTGGA